MLRIVLFAIFLFIFSASTYASQASNIQKLVKQYEELGWFSGNVLVFKHQDKIFESSVGYANLDEGIKNQADTLFDIGSIQKDLTAVLVLQAVDDGLIGLDEPLAKYVSGLPSDISNKVKVIHLLRHTSGIPDVFNAEYRTNFRLYDTIAKTITLVNDSNLLFEPGSDRRYSNMGYVLLGAILEKAYNKDYWALVEIMIMSKLRATSLETGVKPKVMAELYHFSHDGQQVLVDEAQREHKGPAGGGFYSATDLILFYQQLFNGKLLSKSSLTFFKNLQKDNSQWVAFGGGKGVSTAVEINFVSGIWVCVLANTDGLVAEEISERIMRLMHEGEIEVPRVPPTTFAYKLYEQIGKKRFNEEFKPRYKAEGYDTFIGRVLTDLGRNLISAGKPEESIFFFEYLTENFPEMPEVYDGLALGYFSSGYHKEALNAFQKSVAMKPGYQSLFHPTDYVVNLE